MSTDSKAHPINHDWQEFYVLLEGIRRSGICNMFGAAEPLVVLTNYKLTQSQATDILLSWIQNYNELKQFYNWE